MSMPIPFGALTLTDSVLFLSQPPEFIFCCSVADTVFAVVMLLLLMFAVAVLWCCVPLLVSCSALPGCPVHAAEDGAADRHRRAGAAGHTDCCC